MTTAAISILQRSPSRLWLLFVLSLAITISVHYHLAAKQMKRDSIIAQIVYLPASTYLKPLSFGYHSVVADFIYLWSIQYYGDPQFHPHMEYLPRTYHLITELDPHFIDAYETGALFLFYEGRNPKAALKLLDKGLEKNPDQWILPMDAGFYCMYNLRDNDLSAEYFEKAARVPGAPTFPKRMQAGIEFRKGDKRAALRLWADVYEHADSATIKQIAYQHVHDLKVLIDVEALNKAVDNYRESTGRLPFNLKQLLNERLIAQIPLDPEGREYQYDARTGVVKYPRHLSLYNRFQ